MTTYRTWADRVLGAEVIKLEVSQEMCPEKVSFY